jgi:hypothetical protein
VKGRSVYKAQLGEDFVQPYLGLYRKPQKTHLINEKSQPLCGVLHLTKVTTDPLVATCKRCLKVRNARRG